MVTLGMDYHVLPGREEEFERLWADVTAALACQPGHVVSRLFREVQRPGTYLVWSEWSDREALARFTHSQEFRAVTALGRAELLASPPRHRILPIDDLGR